ncbi:MAG TPA: ABC transporter substrate-binding protein [Candidatus Binatia bacterium]|nr:ABC transporter substrate-binding protein [Candidatus Binatia bacterium]
MAVRWILAFLIGCLSVGGEAIGAPLTKVRISYSSRSNSVTPFYLAVQKGFFAEEGMDVELVQVNPRLGATAVLNGDLDFTTTFGSTLRSIVGGFPIKFVAVSVRKSDHFLVARPEIKELKDLKGKRLAVSTLFGTDQRAAEEILRAKGFPVGFVKPIALGDAPVRTQALKSGIVEAAAVSSPFDLTLKAEGYRVLGGPQDIEFALPTSGLAVANRLLQQNPQLVKRAIRAMLKAHRYVFENKKDVVPQMTHYLNQSAEVAARSYDLLVISLSKNGEITDQEWNILTEKKKTPDEVRDFSLLREVQKELKIK